MSTKENIYDEELSPLMSQVAAICQKYGIEMLATFRIPSLDDENLACTTLLPNESGTNSPELLQAAKYLGAIK